MKPTCSRLSLNIRCLVGIAFTLILIGNVSEADKLFLRLQKEFGVVSRMKAVEAQIEYLKFLKRQGNLKAASLLGL